MLKWPLLTYSVKHTSSLTSSTSHHFTTTAQTPQGWVPGAGDYLSVDMTLSIKIYNAGVGALKKNVDEVLMTILTKGSFPLLTFLAPNGKIIRFENPSVQNVNIQRDMDSVTFNIDLIISGEDIKIEDPI